MTARFVFVRSGAGRSCSCHADTSGRLAFALQEGGGRNPVQRWDAPSIRWAQDFADAFMGGRYSVDSSREYAEDQRECRERCAAKVQS